jgi:Kef-type K+ transport system membrane component KefB
MAVFYVYSWYFTNYLVYYMYAGAMPLMWLLGVIFWVFGYVSWKFLTICFYRKTYGFDEEIPLYAIGLMKYGVLFHLCMITFMFTDKRILTPPDYDEMVHYRPVNERVDMLWARRFDTTTNNFVLTFAILICVFYYIYKCIVMPICWYVNKSSAAKKAKAEED